MDDTVGTAYWHIHHDVLMEFATDPIENRIAYIRREKNPAEVSVRLRLLQPVRGELLPQLAAAWRAAWTVFNEAAADTGADQVRALVRAYNQALADSATAIEALHKIECPGCPWDGKTIFPAGGTP